MSARRLSHTAGVVVPLRSFAGGKARLADSLDDDTRRAFTRTMAERVVGAAGSRPVVIVSSAPEVVTWAHSLGLGQIADPGTLDLAAYAGRQWVRDHGLVRVVVMHADLPLATALDGIADDAAAPVAVVRVRVLATSSRADGAVSKCGWCGTGRWASTSTTRPTSKPWPTSGRRRSDGQRRSWVPASSAGDRGAS